MRKLIMIYFGLWGTLHAQCPAIGIERPNVVFYGYNNRVNFGTMDGRPFEAEGIGADLIKQEDGNYILVVKRVKDVQVLLKDPRSGIPFDTLNFVASYLPSPELYFGTAAQGEKAHRSNTVVFAKYPPEIPLTTVAHKILSMEIYIGDRVFHISGNTLTNDVQEALKEHPSGGSIYCIASISSSGTIYKISGEWKLF